MINNKSNRYSNDSIASYINDKYYYYAWVDIELTKQMSHFLWVKILTVFSWWNVTFPPYSVSGKMGQFSIGNILVN